MATEVGDPTSPVPRRTRVLLTGATGYVGGRLRHALEQRPDEVALRCLARRPEYLAPRVAPTTEVVRGDVRDDASLEKALAGVDVAYYLVHAMAEGDAFEEKERQAAETFARVAAAQGVGRIVYLGGLGEGPDLSPHLASRQRTGEVLRGSGVPTLELRASIVIGSGSLSFELIRALVSKLPVMITPRWTRTPAQPIAIEDVVAYLEAAGRVPLRESEVIGIGGADVVSYGDLMREFARQRGMRRWLVPVPALSPRISSLWLGLVTPVYRRIGRQLIEGVKNPSIVRDDLARQRFPEVRPRGMAEAIARALVLEDEEVARTRWSDATSSAGPRRSFGGTAFGTRRIDSRRTRVAVPPDQAFAPIQRIGGGAGWYHADWLWDLRGALDLLLGGVGMRRGRADPERLLPGDPLDFWRVEAISPPHLLRLQAEMKVPGRAWLQFEVKPTDDGGSEIVQTAIFDPVGVAGRAYWYALWPIHDYVFRGMLRAIARLSTRRALRSRARAGRGRRAVRPPGTPGRAPDRPRDAGRRGRSGPRR